MARILAYTSPARGHLFPLTPILVELQEGGHQVFVRTLSSEVERTRSFGFETKKIDPRIEEISLQDWKFSNARAALSASVATFVQRSEFEVPDIRSAIEETNPDFLIIDTNCWGAQAFAQKWSASENKQWASFCPFPVPLSSRDVPPFGLGLRPAHSVLGRVRDAILRPLIIGMLEKTTLAPYNKVRKSVGLGALMKADDLYLTPPLLLLLTAEPFEYPRSDWPGNVRLIGPCDWDPTDSEPEWISEIDKPIVLVSTSSEYQADEKLVRMALEALEFENVFVIVTAPSLDIAEIKLPKNARIEKFLPHSEVLKRASCAITHGGMGVTQKALAHGVPVCAVPFGRDQFEVARRVEVSGAGTRIPAKKLNPELLRSKVSETMSLHEGARRISLAYQEAGGATKARELIEKLLLQ